MNHSTVVYLKHALVPSKREVKPFVGRSLAELDPKWTRPYICLVDGKPVLRKDWDLRIYKGQVVTFIDAEAIPMGGGGGSNPVRIIAMLAVIAISIYAPYAAGLTTTVAGVTTVTTAGHFLSAGVMLVGTALVNALLPAQSMGLSSNTSQTASPTYSLQAQGNMARLGAAIPEQFGRMTYYPDFAAQPYQEFSGNDQFIYQLLCLGVGKHDIEFIGIEDTPVREFEEITYEIVNPGETLDLFPANVVTSEEVAGQEMAYNVYTGEFVVNAAGTTANYLGFDFLAPRGLFHASSSGGLNSATITWAIEACQIDDNGVAIGSWAVLENVSITKATATPQRISRKYAVTPGRYKGRVKRTNVQETGTTWAHEIVWAGFRAYLQDTRDYGDVTLIGMRMKATSQLSSTSARKVKITSTRKLPLWTGSAWTAEQATRDIAPALAYMCKSVGLPDARIDLASLHQLDAVWKARGDEFNGRFDNVIAWWEAITKAARTGRAKPFQQGGVMRVARDQAEELPVALFTMRNILPGSFSQKFLMPTSDTSDSVEVTYFDSGVWRNREVLVALPGSIKAKPAKTELFGVTNRAQAAREGTYDAACNVYRRRLISFSTEMEGFIPSFMDLIAVQHDVPAWGQSGEVVDWDNVNKIATLSEPLTWSTDPEASHYIAFRRANGAPQGPYACSPGETAYKVVMIDTPMVPPYFGADYERSHFSFGWGETVYQLARVLSISPRSKTQVDIECVNEDPNVHTADVGITVPSPETSQLPQEATAPVIRGLVIRSAPEDTPTAVCAWEPTPWANSYIVQQSADGTSWSTVGEPSTPDISFRVLYGNATIIRVAAVGVTRGPWVTAYFGDSADYMWNAVDTTLMWNAVDTTEMWKF